MIEGESEKNSAAMDKRRVGMMSAAVLSLTALLIFAAIQSSPYRASAAEQATKITGNNNNNNNADKSSSSSNNNIATATAKLRQQYWQDFLKLEKESWHYNYGKMEKHNVKAYQKWYCADLRLHGYKDFTHACDPSSYPKGEMWQHEHLRDEILWNKANHQPHHEIKKTDEQMKYLQKRAEMRDNMTRHAEADDKTWRHYLSLEKQAWHYDYAKTEKQNFKAFQKWWDRGGADRTHKMWFSEQYGREILWDKAAGADKEHHNNIVPSKSRMQSWFEEAYLQHKAEIAKNKCVNPWERTPGNAAPSWSACLGAKGPYARQSM